MRSIVQARLCGQPLRPAPTVPWCRVLSSVGGQRAASTSHADISSKGRRRLKFDSTEPLTLKESIRIVEAREAKKFDQRQQALKDETRHITPFHERLKSHGEWPLQRGDITTFQVNIGKLCNLTCRHCHVESGPTKVTENMDYETVQRCVELIRSSPSIETVDITGGAPELNPHFRTLVTEARAMGKTVIDRCNLVVFFEKGHEDLPQFLADNQVRVVASLPCYTEDNTTKQRGKKVFPDSIEAIRMLNRLGYGDRDSPLVLDLVYNPGGPALPPDQSALEEEYRKVLLNDHGVRFSSLIAITNMPIKRFADDLFAAGKLGEYMELLSNSFNAATIDGLMCRNTMNVGWDGRVYDCDFNAALEVGSRGNDGNQLDIWNVDAVSELPRESIRIGKHCYGCTAGTGSSCTGALA